MERVFLLVGFVAVVSKNFAFDIFEPFFLYFFMRLKTDFFQVQPIQFDSCVDIASVSPICF